jgi:hypothetical protein
MLDLGGSGRKDTGLLAASYRRRGKSTGKIVIRPETGTGLRPPQALRPRVVLRAEVSTGVVADLVSRAETFPLNWPAISKQGAG